MVDREESPLYDEVTSKVAAWSAVIFCALGILGNATALFVLIKNKSLRHHPTTPYLISLTLMDLIFSGFNLPLSAHRFFHHGWSLGDEACAAFQFVMNCRVAVSSLSMMVLSFNRFLVLYFPVSLATFFSRRQSSLCVLGLWVVSLAVPGLLAFFQNDSHHANLSDCTSIMNKEHSALISDPFALFVGISCLVMAISCCSIICKVWASGFFQTTDTGLRQDRSVGQINRSRERDLSKTIVIVCACFIICLIPGCIVRTIQDYRGVKTGWRVSAEVIFWCSAIVNPTIYFFAYQYYRQHVFYNVKWLLCMNPQDPTSTNSNPQFIRRLRSIVHCSSSPTDRSDPEEQTPLDTPVHERETVQQFRRSEPVRLTLTNSRSSQQLPMYENVRLQSFSTSVTVTDI